MGFLITIRPAVSTDYPAVARLLRQIARQHCELRPDVFRPAQKYDKKQYAKLLKEKDSPILVAENEAGEVLGYAMCQVKEWKGHAVVFDHRLLYLDDLCVDEACRSQGIGARLMEGVVALARERGLARIELNVWECNEAALRFYERQGFATQKRTLEIQI